MSTFINFSNHPSRLWTQQQIEAALKFGDIKDIPFPEVNPYDTTEDIQILADHYVELIKKENPACVMCQGELCLSYNVIVKLKQNNIKTVAACNYRNIILGDNLTKTTIFEFIQFREY